MALPSETDTDEGAKKVVSCITAPDWIRNRVDWQLFDISRLIR